jgi:uncharacterized membrane protein
MMFTFFFFENCCKFARVDKRERKVEGNQKEVVKERLSIYNKVLGSLGLPVKGSRLLLIFIVALIV